jgi:hypothetical protein
MTKRSCLILVLGLTLLSSPTFVFSRGETNSPGQHGISVKQYEAFHDVLHPLQHEALPKNDFRQIRAKSALLVNRGNAIIRLGVPRRLSKERNPEFRAGLKEFSKALVKFRTDARRGTDEQLKASYSAVHDSFERLADLLPGE